MFLQTILVMLKNKGFKRQYTIMITVVVALSLIIVCAVAVLSSAKLIKAYEKAVLSVSGEYKQVLGPGLVFVPPFVSNIYRYDLREKSINTEKQSTTKDGKTVMARFQTVYRFEDVEELHKNKRDPEEWVERTINETTGELISDSNYNDIQFDFSRSLQEMLRSEVRDSGIQVSEIKIDKLDILGETKITEERADSEYEFW